MFAREKSIDSGTIIDDGWLVTELSGDEVRDSALVGIENRSGGSPILDTMDVTVLRYEAIPMSNEAASVQVWLVERTYSDDEQNLIILTYATPDGTQYYRKERALTTSGDMRETTAATDVDPGNLGDVVDDDLLDRYSTEAQRMRDEHDPDDVI